MNRDKYWDFTVSEHEIGSVIEPVIAAIYPDRVDLRTAVLASWLSDQMNCGGIDFAHDPEHSDEPRLETSEVIDAFGRLFADPADRYVWKTIDIRYGDFEGEHDHRLLFADPDPDGFDPPVNIKDLAAKVAHALSDGVALGVIEVDASEPYDSCSGCGGYHNVNYDC